MRPVTERQSRWALNSTERLATSCKESVMALIVPVILPWHYGTGSSNSSRHARSSPCRLLEQAINDERLSALWRIEHGIPRHANPAVAGCRRHSGRRDNAVTSLARALFHDARCARATIPPPPRRSRMSAPALSRWPWSMRPLAAVMACIKGPARTTSSSSPHVPLAFDRATVTKT
jgi:hypothetical protein